MRFQPRSHLSAVRLAPLLLLGALACDDAATDPMEGLVAAETEAAALALEVPLPTPDLPGLGRVADAEVGQALIDWRASWDLEPDAGRVARGSLYPVLARALDEALDREDVADEVARLGAAVRRANEFNTPEVPQRVRDGIETANRHYRMAYYASDTGDHARALELVLRGGDALREVGPEAVARTLLARVEGAIGRLSEDDPYSGQDRERMRRLVTGARQALEEEDWGLAIRRAYYARGILDGN